MNYSFKELKILFLYFLAFPCLAFSATEDRETTTIELVAHAKRVIAQSTTNNVAAAKEVYRIFDAAERLIEEGKNQQAREYYQQGLQLSPWSMKEQLDYAHLLTRIGDRDQANAIARLVYKTTENTSLRYDSGEMLGLKEPADILMLPNQEFDTKTIYLVRVGNIDNWKIQKIGKRLRETLGIAVYYSPTVIDMPSPTRSFYERWAEILKKDVNWEHPRVRLWMNELNINGSDVSTVDQTLELLARITVLQGNPDPRGQFDEMKARVKARDQQWDAQLLLDKLIADIHIPANVIPIGLTEADIYVDDSNFVFGVAETGKNKGIVSMRRFSAEFNGERENQARYFDRLQKQLLSSIGFALGIERPSDPHSARSYPSDLADHDQKGTWLSPQCIAGFEKALGQKLPKKTYDEMNSYL